MKVTVSMAIQLVMYPTAADSSTLLTALHHGGSVTWNRGRMMPRGSNPNTVSRLTGKQNSSSAANTRISRLDFGLNAIDHRAWKSSQAVLRKPLTPVFTRIAGRRMHNQTTEPVTEAQTLMTIVAMTPWELRSSMRIMKAGG